MVQQRNKGEQEATMELGGAVVSLYIEGRFMEPSTAHYFDKKRSHLQKKEDMPVFS